MNDVPELKSLLQRCLPFLEDVAVTSETYLKYSNSDSKESYSHKRLKVVNQLRKDILSAGVQNDRTKEESDCSLPS